MIVASVDALVWCGSQTAGVRWYAVPPWLPCIVLCTRQVNRHHDVLHLMLDVGGDIDKLNSEGMSALAVCHVLYYPFHCLHAAFTKPPNNTQVRLCHFPYGLQHTRHFCLKWISYHQVLESLSKYENSPDTSRVDPSTCEVALSSRSPLPDPYGLFKNEETDNYLEYYDAHIQVPHLVSAGHQEKYRLWSLKSKLSRSQEKRRGRII